MIKKFIHDDGTVSLKITCDDCGKDIEHSNEYGMFCEDFCGLEESKEALVMLESFLDKVGEIFGDDFIQKEK